MSNERRMLEQHGTQLMALKPSSLWSAAMEDIKRREHNREDSGRPDKMKHYSFHRDHVKKAQTPNDIIRAALKEPGKGQASGKYGTRIIYSDIEALKAALR